jgi:predicted porin
MFFGSVDLGLGYAGAGYNVYVPVGYGLVNYLDKDLLEQLTVEPKIDILLDDLILNVNAKYLKREYKPRIYKIMDDSSYGAGVGAYYLSGKDFVYLKLKYENFSADSIQSLFVDKDLFTAVTGVNYNFADLLVSRLDYRYRKGLYDDNALLKSEKREDDYHQFELKLSHYLNEKLELFASNRYVKNKSNNISTDYTKNITMFGLSANY